MILLTPIRSSNRCTPVEGDESGDNMPLRVLTLVGTRPEVIRLSRTLALLDNVFDHTLVHTGQNYDLELNEIFFEELGLRAPDFRLDVDTSSLGSSLGGVITKLEPVLLDVKPDAFLVLGDTNSCIGALLARRLQIPVYHMEAGNRCFDANVPEEVNRRLVDHVSDFNLVYTEHARRNLIQEGVPARRILLTGSPMGEVLAYYGPLIDRSSVLAELGVEAGQYLVASIHREENVDEPDRLANLLAALELVCQTFDRRVLVSTHPRTRARLVEAGFERTNGVVFHRPFGFLDYVQLQRHAFCTISDSGTISEESAIMGFPAVTVRDAIERPEALEAGCILQAGVSGEALVDAVELAVSWAGVGRSNPIPDAYRIMDCSRRVIGIIRSTAHLHHDLEGVRRRSPIWAPTADPDERALL